jgi:peroxiredoxin
MRALGFGLFLTITTACGGGAGRPAQVASTTPAPAVATSAKTEVAADDDTSALIGHEAPPWEASTWFNSPPLSLEGLRGKVVFVRWFTSPDCPFCSGSAPALRALHESHAKDGLVVVGMYHHKSKEPLDPEDVRGWADHYGYTFPVAIDAEWKTLRRWWLDGHPHRGYTSVSFLIDRHGIIRRVHLGGLIDVKSAEFAAIDADVVKLLAEK